MTSEISTVEKPQVSAGLKNAWHSQAAAAIIAALKSDLEQGLDPEAAANRLAEIGPNELQAAQRISPWRLLLEQFKNILIVILLVATGLSAFLGHGIEAIAIAVIVLFAVLLGFVQEYRAERAIEALRQMAAPTATVMRGGHEVEIPARDVVPGDLVLLRAGGRIPADARLVKAVNFQVDEAPLTGESMPVEKHAGVLTDPHLGVGDRKNMVYAGTTATYGRARAIVVATGMQTEFGKIAQMLQTVEISRTPLQENLDKVGHVLARAAFVVVAIIVAMGLFRGQPFIEMLIFGIALAVAVVPEALPAVVTISLAIGVQRMVKRNALVRRLPAVETLGSTTIICSDKTGTLTKDEMTAVRLWVDDHLFSITGEGYDTRGEFMAGDKPADLTQYPAALTALWAAVLDSDAYLETTDGAEAAASQRLVGDPTEGALVVAAGKAGVLKETLGKAYPRLNEVPFDSDRKIMSVILDVISPERSDASPFDENAEADGEVYVIATKGAPDVLLERCSSYVRMDDVAVPMTQSLRERILAANEAMARDALRVIGVAYRTVDAPPAQATPATVEQNLNFLGLFGIIDPPRPEAKAAIETCEQAGIRAVMITGDHPLTAQAIAGELGLLKKGRVVTGAELEAMSDEALEREVEDIEVYARVSPAHKLRVVTALQKKGHIAAMTGDGVNDAPALKKADIGIAMGITGTDVTKEAAAMMLTDDNFASIVAAVEEGRIIFGNIKKYLMYLLSSNIGEIVLMAGATLLGMPLPLTAVQILYVNLATDGLPALALAVDPPEPDLMRRPPRNPRVGIFTRPVVILMLVGGLWSAAVNLGLFGWAINSGRSIEEAMTMTFVSLVLIQFFKAYNFRSDRHSVLDRPFANKWLNLAIFWELILLALVVYLPVLHGPFGTFSLPLVDWLIVIGLAFTVSPVIELAKWLERRGLFGKLV